MSERTKVTGQGTDSAAKATTPEATVEATAEATAQPAATTKSKIDPALLALFNSSKEQGVKPVISDTTAEEYAQMANSVVISDYRVSYANGRMMYRASKDTHVPCQGLQLAYRNSLIKSTAREGFGSLIKGASIDVIGWDIERDGEGRPLFEEVPNPAAGVEGQPATVKQYLLITKDENGNDLEPQVLMSWRVQWGINRSKALFARVKDLDMLNLVPNRGVPFKDRAIADSSEPAEDGATTVDKAKSQYSRVAWELIPGLEEEMKKPLTNALLTGNETLLAFIDTIPVASNAPSVKQQAQGQAGVRRPVIGANTSSLPNDAFATAPEKK